MVEIKLEVEEASEGRSHCHLPKGYYPTFNKDHIYKMSTQVFIKPNEEDNRYGKNEE